MSATEPASPRFDAKSRITLTNLLGSVAFGVSAVASYVIPATGEPRNAARANLGTLVRAVCFLVGALLLLPERTEEPTTALGGDDNRELGEGQRP